MAATDRRDCRAVRGRADRFRGARESNHLERTRARRGNRDATWKAPQSAVTCASDGRTGPTVRHSGGTGYRECPVPPRVPGARWRCAFRGGCRAWAVRARRSRTRTAVEEGRTLRTVGPHCKFKSKKLSENLRRKSERNTAAAPRDRTRGTPPPLCRQSPIAALDRKAGRSGT